MGFIFLDIETYSSKEEPMSSLNPYFNDSKVIVISYNIYPNFEMKNDIIQNPTFLFEWESSEKNILELFYQDLKQFIENQKYPKIVGFNHSNFDLIYLYGRLLKNEIDTDKNLHKFMFRIPRFIDLIQVGIQFSNYTKKYGELGLPNQKELNKLFNIPIKEEEGKNLSKFYDLKEFELIKKYVIEEFTFETLYIKFRDQFIKCRQKNCFNVF